MCGIFAVVERHGLIRRRRVADALTKIAHRGPDGEGSSFHPVNESGELALGHRRLSVFDLSSAGAQPMAGQANRMIVFNGEIFNWPELRSELEHCGYSFRTGTDTEVVLAAYDHWGTDCLRRFNGFWAFVLFDPSDGPAGSLFMSRDHFGIKPLYYRNSDSSLIAASEIGAIAAYRGVDLKVDPAELARQVVLQRSDDTTKTIYRDIFELPPAHGAKFDIRSGSLSLWTYWQPDCEQQFEGTDEQVLDRFEELLEQSVRFRLRADREVALTLSGGIDSSAIAVAAARAGRNDIRAFTSHFPDHRDIDETHYAALVAQRLGFPHQLVQPDMKNLAQEEQALTRHQEIMYGGFSLLVNWAVLKQISAAGISLFLTGQGGDEIFLGYERYFIPYLLTRARKRPWGILHDLKQISGNSRLSLRSVLAYAAYFSNRRLRNWRYRDDAHSVFAQELVNAVTELPQSLALSLFELQKQEICGFQLRHLLRYDDRTAAAFGLEGRPAFLDPRLVEFGLSLGWDHKIRGGWSKFTIRRYLERHGLPEIAWRRHKLGYNAPTLEWTNELLQTAIQSDRLKRGHRYLKPGLDMRHIPDRMKFRVYNLLSTASEMEWNEA